ncbi:MAG: YfhO family protein [Clostridiales bacterium]|nr:YfhO family protein [Clostridiales bacterium]
MKIKGFLIRNKLIFIAFFVPVLLVTLAFAVRGIYPFGEDQIAVIDMYHQYVPFLSELQYKIQEGGSLFYTWNGAGGSNFWNLIAYYGASPLNLILALFPKKLIMEGITIVLIIKIGLAGSFMALFLRYCGKNCNMVTVGFAVLYALNSYIMAYYWCIMWMDAVMLLPLCMLGLHNLIDEGKFVLYTVTLAVIVFTNYYIAIMVCIFIMFYYPVLYFIKVDKGGASRCLKTTGKAVGFSFLAIAMASTMLLPTYISMQSTYYISSEMPENWLFYRDALDIVNQLLPNAQLTFREGAPNLYCGLIVVILLVFYIISKTIPFKEKALNMAFLTFMFLSLNVNKLDFLWHGLHFPNQLPFRYTFVICFVLISMAYKTFMRIDQVRVNAIWAVFAGGIGYYLIAEKLFEKDISNITLFFYGGLIWLALYTIVMIIYKRDMIKQNAFLLLIVILIISEAFCSVCTSVDKIGSSYRDSYFANIEDINKLVEETREEFVRTEMDDSYILNCPAMYHYKGISQFSSSINADTTALMEKLGVEGAPGKNRFNYNLTDPVTNAILNIKYLIGKNMPVEDSTFKEIDKSGYTRLYESKYPLSIGYMTGNEIRTWDTDSLNPFENLNDYVRAATGNSYKGVFHDIGNPRISAANANVTVTGDGLMTGALESKNSKSKIMLKYTSEETRQYYVFVEATSAAEIAVKNGNQAEDIEVRNDCGSVVNIGTVKAGEDFWIEINYDPKKIGNITSHVCYMDEELWDQAYAVISKDMLKITEYSDTSLKGTIHTSQDGMLVTSIPYEKGWILKVDGKEKEITEFMGGAFISTPMTQGDHEVELTFRPPGLILGIIMTIISLAVLVMCYFLQRARRSSRTEEISDSGI